MTISCFIFLLGNGKVLEERHAPEQGERFPTHLGNVRRRKISKEHRALKGDFTYSSVDHCACPDPITHIQQGISVPRPPSSNSSSYRSVLLFTYPIFAL
jgi:hypothetical protein